MPIRKSTARWEGGLKEGRGSMRLGSGLFEGAYDYKTRFEEEPGTNPDELVAAAHAGCFSMYLGGVLQKAGHPAEYIQTEARVVLGKDDVGPKIEKIKLSVEVKAPGLDQAALQTHAETSKKNCPVSRALAAVPTVELEAKLVS
jgi:osmotically inducible protein OsmC